VLVQEHRPGESEYALLLRHRGEVRMHFAYRSARGAARWDGRLTSLVRMEDDGPVQEAAKLLDACDYEGLASVEFRRDADGRRCLVGIDRIPWCGAVVALSAGLDFSAAWLDSLREGSSPTATTPSGTGIRRTLVSSRFADATRALPSGGPEELASPRLTRLWDLRNPLIGRNRFCWSDPAPRAAAVAAFIDGLAQRVLTPMTHDPGRNRLLAGAAGLAERAKTLSMLASPALNARAASRRRSAFPLRIFMFHAVIDRPLAVPHYCFVQRTLFRRQLELIRRHYRVLPVGEAVRRLRAGELQEPSAAITFDDGFENNFTLAYPELQRLELPASIFVATGFTDSHQTPWFCRVLRAVADTRARALEWNGRRFELSWRRAKILTAAALMAQLKRQAPDTLEADLGCIEALLGFEARRPVDPGSPFRMLGVPAIREMATSGLMEFGGHTTTHSILSNLAVDGQRREIEESLHALGRILDKPCPLFAYPNGASGDYDEDSIGCLRDAGVSVALTAMAGANPWFGDPFELRREAVGPPDLAARFAARIERMVRIDRLHAGAAT
jgi:peptidoglycan/xylan/chitin deacetylase (PgdA/CDA1 family)